MDDTAASEGLAHMQDKRETGDDDWGKW